MWDIVRTYVQKTKRGGFSVVKSRGYALNSSEFEEGLTSLAVPVRNSDNEVIAAINVSLPSVRMSEEKEAYFYKNLKSVSELISKEISFRGG